MPVSHDVSSVGTEGVAVSVRWKVLVERVPATGMVTGVRTGTRTMLPFDAVEVLCMVLVNTINVEIALVVDSMADHKDGVVDIKVCDVSPVPELDQVISDALDEFPRPGIVELLEYDVEIEILFVAGIDVSLGIDRIPVSVQNVLDDVELRHSPEELMTGKGLVVNAVI
jgi:hypothetical protein